MSDWASRRQRLFRGEPSHGLVWTPAGEPEHLLLRLRLIAALGASRFDEAVDLSDEADTNAPSVEGELDGCKIDAWRDTDDRTASVLELVIDGRYAWVPFEALRRVRFHESPSDEGLLSVEVQYEDASPFVAGTPLLYPDSEADDRAEIRDGSATDWHAPGDGPTCALGGRVWDFDGVELSPSDIGAIELFGRRVSLL